MMIANRLIVVAGATLALAACSFADEVLWPGATGEESAAQTQTTSGGREVPIQPSAGETAAQTDAATTGTAAQSGPIVASQLPSGSATGTIVGARVAELQRELAQLQRSVASDNGELQQLRGQSAKNGQSYNSSVSDVRSRLQVGTTPGNPEVIALWNKAQNRLDSVNADIGPMTNLASKINNDVTVSSFLLDSIRASFNLAGGVDADHRNLEKLENAATESLQQASQMQAAINGEITQQAAYVSSERQNMTSLAMAIDKGHFLNAPGNGRSFAGTAGGGGNQVASVAERRPLVMIRFDRADVQYEEPLFSAANQALQRFPNAQFDLVAVAPAGASPAVQESSRRNAEKVMRSLTNMGVPANRVTMSAAASPTVATEEVHIFVR
ncbi:MAG: hypothetical protein GY791_15745 [Alphaproteobacteria bacterium]|nr:hypothetical protein [Alphaproteobacteria bacterium]